MLTTKTSKLVVALVAFLAWTPAAYAWSAPVQGLVLKPFSYDAAHPYAPGQHRGIDIGADADGESVVAPAAGTVSFAGTVPTNGKSLTIQTADGYSVTLTHLGSILVTTGAVVAERDAIGTIGPSGTAEEAVPYVHLGIRLTADPDGYLDPLSFLPPPAPNDGGTDGSTPAQPASGVSSSTTPGSEPAPATPSAPHERPATPVGVRGRGSHEQDKPAEQPPAAVRTRVSAQSPAVRADTADVRRAQRPQRPLHSPRSESAVRRPVVEAAVPVEPAALGAGHELRSSTPLTGAAPPRRGSPAGQLPLLLNGAAALVALAAALAARRSRRRGRTGSAQVLRLPRSPVAHRPASRAA